MSGVLGAGLYELFSPTLPTPPLPTLPPSNDARVAQLEQDIASLVERIEPQLGVRSRSRVPTGGTGLSSTSPKSILVTGDSDIGDFLATTSDPLWITTFNATGTGTSVIQGNLTVSGTCSGCGVSIPGEAGHIQFSDGSEGLLSSANLLFDNTNGLLGIATTSPVGQLSIETGTSTFPFFVGDFGTSSPIFMIGGDGRVAIGTSTQSVEEPSALFVNNSVATDHNLILRAAPSQSAHIFMIESSDGTDLFTVAEGGETKINHVAEADNDIALDIECDDAGFGDVNCLFIDVITGAISAGESESGILINLNIFASTGGDVHGITFLSTTGGAEVHALEIGVGIAPLVQLSGTFGDMNNATSTDSGTETNRTAAFTSTGTDVAIFPANNDDIIIGDAVQFSEIEVVLDTVASGAGIKPQFHFSTGDQTWTLFSPTDGTNGMRDTGEILWELSDIPTWAVGSNQEYQIRITRTQGGLGTIPIEDLIQITAVNKYSISEDGIAKFSEFMALDKLTSSANLFVIGGKFELGSGSATSTYNANATSTMLSGFQFATGVDAAYVKTTTLFTDSFHATSTSATSTIAFGLDIAAGGLRVIGDARIDNLNLSGNFIFGGDTYTDLAGDGTLSVVSGALRVIDLTCTNCIGETEISDVYLVNNAADSTSGILTVAGLDLGTQGNRIDFDTDNDTSLRSGGDDDLTFEIGTVDVALWDNTAFNFNPTTIDRDFIIDGNSVANLFFLNAGTDRIGFGTTTPGTFFSIDGATYASSTIVIQEVQHASTSAAFTIDWDVSNSHVFTIAQATTLTFTGGEQGGNYTATICQSSQGSHTVVWPDGDTIIWQGQEEPTLTTTADRCDVITFKRTAGTSTPKFLGIETLDF